MKITLRELICITVTVACVVGFTVDHWNYKHEQERYTKLEASLSENVKINTRNFEVFDQVITNQGQRLSIVETVAWDWKREKCAAEYKSQRTVQNPHKDHPDIIDDHLYPDGEPGR